MAVPDLPDPLELDDRPEGERVAGRRLLLVHAHPDDETLGTGATIAAHVADGTRVTVVTCTAGEEGEVLVPELAHVSSDRDDALAEHRRDEIAEAMAALGVTDHRWLGGFGRYRDSGMAGTPTTARRDAFCNADLLEAASHLVGVIREVRPQVVVTYDENGEYGHPDHVQAHRVTTYAVALAAAHGFRPDLGDAWEVAKVYWTALPASVVRAGVEALRAAGGHPEYETPDSADDLASVPDDVVTTVVDATEHLPSKVAALRAYRTQLRTDGEHFALTDHVAKPVSGVEHYRLVKGAPVGVGRVREHSLFEGLPRHP